MVAAKDTINVTTNAPLGYKLMLSSSSSSLNPASSASGSAKFNAVSGTISSPSTLTPDSWGYSLTEQSLPIPSSSSTWIGSSTTPTEIHKYDYANIPNGDNIDIYYGINATTNLPSDTYSTTITYTAIAEGTTDIPTMQDFTYTDCNNLATGSSTTLMDIRNGANYRVTKLADGNCWMTQNLRLDGGITLNSSNTNLPSGTEISLPENIEEGTVSNATDLQIIRNKVNETTGERYDGNLYNWCAATLNNTDCNTTTTEATQDICPKGWRLPSNTGNPSYTNLFTAGGVSTQAAVEAAPYYFSMAGLYMSSYGGQNSDGFYWTRSAYNGIINPTPYYFQYSSSVFYPQYIVYDNIRGFSIRCVYQGTMQSFSIEDCNSLATDSQKTLIDIRNNKEYKVVKARDGNCWMADNLWLYNKDTAKPLTISSKDSDFGSSATETTFTIPPSSNWNSNITDEAKLHVATNSGYQGEAYYNWYSATAGSTASSGTVSTSVCPKGWRLPINGNQYQNKSMSKLLNSYGYTKGSDFVNSTNILGITKYYGNWNWADDGEAGQGSYGYFWSSTAYSTERGYNFLYANAALQESDYSMKGRGLSIRCVLNGTEEEQMQNFTLADCANMATDTTTKLYDRRNGQQYNIVKARDGNCWMADNLNIVNMTVSAADSDFTSGTFTIPATSNWSSNIYNQALVHTASDVGSYATTDTSYYGEQYYNWCSATAQASCGGTSVATTSICPKNWKLPLNGDKNTNYSYTKLFDSYSLTTGAAIIAKTELGFAKYYGNWDGSLASEVNQGSYGFFWPAAPSSADRAYYMYYGSGAVGPQLTSRKGEGYSLRCLLRN